MPPATTVADGGSIRSETGGAPETVNGCVPVTTPAPAALNVAMPAVVSW